MRHIFLFLISTLILSSCSRQEENKAEEEKIKESNPKQVLSETPEDSNLIRLNEAIRNNINKPELYVKRSKIYDSIGDSQSAVEDLDRAYRLDSTNINTLLAQSKFLANKGKVVISLNILEKAKQLYPEDARIYIQFSELYLMGRNNERSLKNADLAIKYDKYNAEAYYLKGYNFLELGDTTKAISSYRTAVEQNPEFLEAYLELGLIFSAKDDPIAIQYYNNALEVNPTEKRALYSKGMFEQEHELYNEAIQSYYKATKAHPNFKEAYYNLGYVHMYYLQLYREALPYFTDAVEIDPSYYQAYYNRGYTFELMGDINNAAKDYRKALSIKPDYDLAAKGLSRVTENI